jgi:hypothetical protein
MLIYPIIIIIGGILVLVYNKLASNEIFSPSNKIHQQVGRAKDLSAPLYALKAHGEVAYGCDSFMLPSLNIGERAHITDWCVP